MTGFRLAVALAVIAGLFMPVPRAMALSPGETPSAEEVLDQAELIVVARAGAVLGTVDDVRHGLRTLYRLHVESYLRPSLPGPDTLVLSVLGGMSLDRAMDAPQPGSGRGLYFLKRTGDVYREAVGPFTPMLPLDGDDFAPEVRERIQPGFAFLRDAPRYPAVRPPVVRLNGRRIGGAPVARLVKGRTLFPARALAAATGAALHFTADDGAVRMEREGTALHLAGDDAVMAVHSVRGEVTVPLDVSPQADGDELMVPLRAVAAALGVGVRWDAEHWTVVLTLPEDPAVPTYLTEAEASGHLAAEVDAVKAQSRSPRTFDGYFTVTAARFSPDWIDPRTGGERPVWELDVATRTGPRGPPVTAMVDAVTGELLYYTRDPRGGTRR